MNTFVRELEHHKLIIFAAAIVFAYIMFNERSFAPYQEFLSAIGLIGVFIGGCFYAYGFTAIPATVLLLSIAKGHDIWLAAAVGGLGALIGDMVIFLFIRYSVSDDIRRLSKEKIVRIIKKEEKKVFGKFQHYINTSFAGFLIASPLPTEIGVTLMASLKHITARKFAVIAYALHTIGIFVILYAGQLI